MNEAPIEQQDAWRDCEADRYKYAEITAEIARLEKIDAETVAAHHMYSHETVRAVIERLNDERNKLCIT